MANIVGTTGNDALTGTTSDDTIDGGTGADTMSGLAGNDTYIVDNTGDVTVENPGEGTDTVLTSVNYTLAVNLENITLTGTAAFCYGNEQANILTGNASGNSLIGLGGNDWLDGGLGSDTMTGGDGDDTYIVDNAGDLAWDFNGGGNDTVMASVSYSLYGMFVDNIILTGAAGINATGNSQNNVLTGNAGANTLTGASGDDRLDGGAGADTMIGGFGSDVYVVDNASDTITELSGQGNDEVRASVSFSLAGQFAENLTLTGSGNIDATGNSMDNILTGNSGDNHFNGGYGDDHYIGGLGADIFVFGTASGADYIHDFSAAQNDSINIHAYAVGHVQSGWLSQVGGDVVITLGGSNVVTVLGATLADVSAHMVW